MEHTIRFRLPILKDAPERDLAQTGINELIQGNNN